MATEENTEFLAEDSHVLGTRRDLLDFQTTDPSCSSLTHRVLDSPIRSNSCNDHIHLFFYTYTRGDQTKSLDEQHECTAYQHLGEEMALPANTKSTTTTETVRGEHRFDIDGYIGKLRAGRVLTSETFVVGGLDWAVRYHPAGAEVGDEEYMSVFVRLVTPNGSARALYDLRLVDRATGLPRSARCCCGRRLGWT